MRVKTFLKKKQMTQAELSRKSGLNVTDINLFVNGKKKLSDKHIKSIAKVLKTKPDQIKRNNIAA